MLVALTCGCGSDNPLGRKAISGTVTVDGKPIPNGAVNFEPLQAGGVGSGAVINDGAYGIDELEGLPPGKDRVSITALEGEAFTVSPGKMPGDEDMPTTTKSLIPEGWNADGKEDIEVKAEGPFEFNFEIVTKK
jgi:hypothetical protein